MRDISQCAEWSVEWGPLVTKYGAGLKKTADVAPQWIRDVLTESRQEAETHDQQGK